MTARDVFRLSEQSRVAVDALADLAVTLREQGPPPGVRGRMVLALTDLAGVTVAGMRTPELRDLVAAWSLETGPHRTIGTQSRTTASTASLLEAVASCCLELDEGNKHAAGHPAAHVVPAALAVARQRAEPVGGAELLAAVTAGYEVATRFGSAVRRAPDWHTHGHWGVTGAATAAALLLGADRATVAAAIDSSTDLMTAAPWQAVLAGDFARNLWVGRAAEAGVAAARLAVAGLAANRGGAAGSVSLLGSLDPDRLTEGLGSTWLSEGGYLKQHSSCAYTHAAVDLVLALRPDGGWPRAALVQVEVATHSLAAPLLQRNPGNRLAAMFSLPFVVGCAVAHGRVTPDVMAPASAAFALAQAVSEQVEVRLEPDLDALLPGRRAAEVVVHLAGGGTLGLGQPNPVGDTDHFPLSAHDVRHKLAGLLGAADADRVVAGVRDLLAGDDVVAALDVLP